MSKEDSNDSPDLPTPEDDGSELETFAEDVDDGGMSLEDLSSAYAQLLGQGHDPYQPIAPVTASPSADPEAPHDQELAAQIDELTEEADPDDACELSPRTIVEAILFVGHPNNEPMTAAQLAALMRGVRPEEVEEIVRDLNESYRAEGCPYQIASEGAGFRMTLREEFRSLRDHFYGRVKEARLSQAAIDVLAVVAYSQPVTREELDARRDKESGAILNQLVRRRLLRIERREDDPHLKLYHTTDRFLELFGLSSLDDLPRTQDMER